MTADTNTLQVIADEFVSLLPDRMAEIDNAYNALKQSAASPDNLNHFYHKVHNLAGSGGTFGFTQLGQTARKILKILEPAVKGEAALTTEVISSVEPVLRELQIEARSPVQAEGWF